MKFSINKVVLLRELEAALGAIEKKTTIPILAYLKLSTEGDELVIQSSDLDISITCRCMAKVSTKGAICLPAVRLRDIVKSVADGDVEFWQKGDDAKVEIKAGRSRFNLAGLSVAGFPDVANSVVEFRNLPSGAFAEAMRRGRIAITKDESRYALNGVNMEIENGTVRFVSTDSHRLSISERKATAFEGVTFKQIVPAKAVGECVRLADLDTVVGIAFDDKQIYFKFGNRVMATRMLSGQFPNWPLTVPKEKPKATITVKAGDMVSLINRVAILAEGETRTIGVELSNGQLAVFTNDSAAGNSHDSIAVDYEGDTFKMGFNATYLMEYFAALGANDAVIEFRSEMSQLVIRLKTEDQTESAFGIVMPLRL